MGIDRTGYMAEAQWISNARNGGGTYDPEGFGYPWRIVLHTIEGSSNPGMIAGHQYPPHLWYSPRTRAIYQTVPLSRSGFALYQASTAPHYTNKARALQVEIEGFAAQTGSWPQQWLDNLTNDIVVPICRWVALIGGSINLNDAPAPGAIPNSATANAPQRFTPQQWAVFNGLCSHRHIPMGDDHWDTGALDTPRIAQHAALIIAGGLDTQPGRTVPEEDDVSIIVQLQEPGDPQHESLWAVDGLLKRRIHSLEEMNRLLTTGAAKKQPDGAPFVSWNINQLRPLATVEEWSFADLPMRIASAVASTLNRPAQ